MTNMLSKNVIVYFVILLMIGPSVITCISCEPRQNIKDIITSKSKDNKAIIEMMNSVNVTILSEHLTGLLQYAPRYIGTQNCTLAAEYLYNKFEELGLYVYFEDWEFPIFRGRNVVATLNGTNVESDAVYIVCAHYDTAKNSPGAVDDGSGVTAMLTIAKILSNYSFNHTIKFIAFSGEEVGAYGSYAHAKNAYERNENIRAVLNLDMVGFTTDDGKDAYLSHHGRSAWIYYHVKEIAERYKEYLDINVQPLIDYPADAYSFRDLGYDAVLITEESIYDSMKIWNSENDTIDKVNFSYLEKMTKLILTATATLAGKPIDVQIRITTPYENTFYLFDKPISQLPGFNIRRTQFRGMTYVLGSSMLKVNITTNEEIEFVYFYFDNMWMSVLHNPPFECKIQNGPIKHLPLIGKHKLRVFVCTHNQKTAMDEMDIFIVKLF